MTAVLTAFVSAGLDCQCGVQKEALQRLPTPNNVVDSFHLTRSELCKFKVFIFFNPNMISPNYFLTNISVFYSIWTSQKSCPVDRWSK